MAKGVKGSSPKPEERPKRTSFLLGPLTQKKLRYIAFHEEREMTTVVAEALNEYFAKWEKKHGKINIK